MHGFDNIQNNINRVKPDFATETIPLEESLGRVLSQDVFADMEMPPFDKSAMDGYACRAGDLGSELKVVEVISAGKLPQKKLQKFECAKIMTGAALPAGADLVFKVEDTNEIRPGLVKCTNPQSKKNICYRGEDYKQGMLLLSKGLIINTAHIAVMASAGNTNVTVSKRPNISVIATGSELVEPNQIPEKGKIRNSNGTQIISQLKKMNLDGRYLGICRDDWDMIRNLFRKALETSKIIIFTGGASMGDFDLIPDLLKEEGFNIVFNRTGMKPGNPMTYSLKGDTYCFGLSGNPVSSMVQFELIAKPIIYRLMGAELIPYRIKAIMNFEFKRKKSNRFGLKPVLINESGLIDPIPFNGSAHINAFSNANAMMEIPTGINKIEKGEFAYVRPI